MMNNNNQNNNQKGFNSGVMLIAIGAVGLFFTLSDIPVVFSVMWKFWPVLLLMAGFLLLPIKSFIKIILLTVTIIVSCVIYALEVKDNNYECESVYLRHDDKIEMIAYMETDVNVIAML